MSDEKINADLTKHALQQITPILARTLSLLDNGQDQYIVQTCIGTNIIIHAIEYAREAGAPEDYITKSLELIISNLRNPQYGIHTVTLECDQ